MHLNHLYTRRTRPLQKTRGGDELTNFRDTSHYCEQLAWHTTKETILATSISDRMLRYADSVVIDLTRLWALHDKHDKQPILATIVMT